MRGGIYTDQKCPKCGGVMQDDPRRRRVCCPKHPSCEASRFRVSFGSLCKRFRSYQEAERWLNGVRFKTDEQLFDERDYRQENPLGFETLARKWLELKKREIKTSSWRNLRNYIGRATAAWGGQNIRSIGYAEIEDFLHSQTDLSDKTRANLRSALHTFFTWCVRRRVLRMDQMPEFPEVHFELGWRNTVSKETQAAILAEIRKISWEIDPKIWLGVRWLCIYVELRPADLLSLRERDVDPDAGVIVVPRASKKRGGAKIVPLLPADIEFLRGFPRAFPDLPFFRHARDMGGTGWAGGKFGPKFLWRWWKRACANLGIEGVDLYGGTRHSTVTALGAVASVEDIKAATDHQTNKAFERYFQAQATVKTRVSALADPDNALTMKIRPPGKSKRPDSLRKLGGGGGS
ncbi:MAG: site-specific integrase [Thermodesulfobacteriota bacterium]